MRIEHAETNSHPLQKEQQTRQITPAMEEAAAKKRAQNEKIINKEEIQTVVSKLNGFTEPLRTNLKFKLHEDLNEYYVTVVNPDTDETIKEIPPKKMLDMYYAIAEYMGILVDEKI